MSTFIVTTKNKADESLLSELLKRMKISAKIVSDEEASHYDPKFLAKIKRGQKQIAEGKIHKVDLNDIWK